jgi:replicative DNA helicase
MVSLIGRPQAGKTYLMLSSAHHAWTTINEPIAFYSMEIKAQKLAERLTALHTRMPADFFKDGLAGNMFGKENAKLKVKKDLIALEGSGLPSFLVLDGNLTSTVDDVIATCAQAGAAAVWVDGAYLLRAPSNRGRLFERVIENCEGLKRDVATGIDIPVFASWQFSREATKLKKGAVPGLEHIAHGDVIGQLSSIVMGMFDEEESTNNAEKLNRRRIHILKGRDGEMGVFDTHWDFVKMNFGEISKKDDSVPLYLEQAA